MIVYDKIKSNKVYSNERFWELKGFLNDKIANWTLAEFLYYNLGVTTFLLTGWRLFPFQEIILRSWFDHNYNINIWSRGGSKSTLVSIFCCLYPLFFPETKIVLASNAFRSTRRLLVQIERIINGKRAHLLKQCFPNLDGTKLPIQRRNDEWLLPINGGHIKALPLNEKVRGERAEILIIDEIGMVPETQYTDVLMPFLASRSDIAERLKIQEEEESLSIVGNLTEEQKTMMESNKKIIGLGTAGYEFEFIYKLYNQWVDKLVDPLTDNKIGRKYFVSRLSYKALPEELIDKEIAELAKGGGEQSSSFQREFMAKFVNNSDGFFNIRKLHEYTIKNGDLPCVQLRGNPDSKYILSCDPNFDSSASSDMFGLGVYLLNNDNRSITQVHSYGKPGGNLSDHLEYLHYILTNFNIVFIIADLAGEGEGNNFISTANQSNLFVKNNIKLSFIDGDFDAEDYANQLCLAKNSYNLSNKKIVYRQIFKSEWLRKSNELLQSQIDYGKIHFASQLSSHEEMMKKAIDQFGSEMPIKYKDRDEKILNLLDFIGLQDDLINQTKHQLALIEVRASDLGTLKYDLPQSLRRSKNPDRARKDLYTCILMACWGAKCYWDFLFTETKKVQNMFQPVIIR